MKRIVVADDGSEAALVAVELAVELAAAMGAELLALAVGDTRALAAPNVAAFARSEGIDPVEAQDAMLASVTRHLDRCRDLAARRGVTRFRAARRAGEDPALAIIEFAAENEADLIVVGSRGHSRIPGLLLGSVSQKLAAHAPCSVLIAR